MGKGKIPGRSDGLSEECDTTGPKGAGALGNSRPGGAIGGQLRGSASGDCGTSTTGWMDKG